MVLSLCTFVSYSSNTGTTTEALNFGSYNYLGFAENCGPCADAAIDSIRENGIGVASSRLELGMSPLHCVNLAQQC